MLDIKCIKGSTHYLDDKLEFDVSSEGLSSGIGDLIPDKEPLLKTSNSCLSPTR